MTCHTLREAIVDVARGVAIGQEHGPRSSVTSSIARRASRSWRGSGN